MFLQATAIVASTPTYGDWTFWSFVVAAIALATSLAGPVRRFFKATRLVLEVHPRIALDHTFGNPQANLYVDLRNTGGRDIRVNAMRITIKRDNSEAREIGGQVYFETTNSKDPLLLVPFNIKASDNWSYPVKFFAQPDRQLDQKIRLNTSKLRSDIIEQRVVLGQELADKTLMVASEELVKPFIDLFNKQFFWTAGEYFITIAIMASPATGSLTKSFRFVIYESEADDLKVEIGEYKFGGGIYFDNTKHTVIFPPISLA